MRSTQLIEFALIGGFAVLVISSIVSGFSTWGALHYPTATLRLKAVVLAATPWTDPAILGLFIFGPLVLAWQERRSDPGALTSLTGDFAVWRRPRSVAVFNVEVVFALLAIGGGVFRIIPWLGDSTRSDLPGLDAYNFLGQGLVAILLGGLALYVVGRMADGDFS